MDYTKFKQRATKAVSDHPAVWQDKKAEWQKKETNGGFRLACCLVAHY